MNPAEYIICRKCKNIVKWKHPHDKYCEDCLVSEKVKKRPSKRNQFQYLKRKGIIKPLEILDEYGGLCALCDRPIDTSLSWPDKYCLTLDHIVPVHKDGSNDRSNLRPAHLFCNAIRHIPHIYGHLELF